MTITTVHLVRHGEVHNPDGVLYGRLPGFGLSATGQAMATAVRRALAGRDVVALWSSPLERAQQTAAPLAEEFGLSVHLDDRLIESSNVFEGRTITWSAKALRNPRLWPHLYNPMRPSWGEPYDQIAARMLSLVADARAAAAGHEIVCVSHQLPIWVVRRALERRRLWHRPDRRQCGLASITALHYDGERLAAIRYSEPAGPLARIPVTPGA
jgi:broad specificity phosphatase PhoE